MEFSSLSIVLNVLFYVSLSADSLPDCRGVFEEVQYKPLLVFDVCVASYFNYTLTSRMYKCDNINNRVVEVEYDGEFCDDEKIISVESLGISRTYQFVNCDSPHICHYAKTRSHATEISDDCVAKTHEWFEKIYPVDWCYSYNYGTSTEITCNKDVITSTTLLNNEMVIVSDVVANCDVGSFFQQYVVVQDGQCEFVEEYDSDYPFYTEIEECYPSKSLQFAVVMSIVFVLLVNVLFI